MSGCFLKSCGSPVPATSPPRWETSRWSLTPLGHRRAADVVGEIDAAKLEPQLAAIPGAELGHAWHTTLAPTLAPAKWSRGIAQLLDRFPFETNVSA